MREPAYITYHTGGAYAVEAFGLVQSLAQHGLTCTVYEFENLGSWEKNCQRKAEAIGRAFEDHPARPIVWLDSDARVLQRPVLFESLDCDFAAHWKDGVELLSGTLYFAPTPPAQALLGLWRQIMEPQAALWDQIALASAVGALRPRGLRLVDLPATYTKIFDLMASAGPAVIEHYQASRRLKGTAGLHSEDRI